MEKELTELSAGESFTIEGKCLTKMSDDNVSLAGCDGSNHFVVLFSALSKETSLELIGPCTCDAGRTDGGGKTVTPTCD